MGIFKTWTEAIKHNKIDKTAVGLNYILELLPHENVVKFCLYCIKDYQQSGLPLREEGLDAINLIERWIQNNKAVTKQNLLDAADTLWDLGEIDNAIYSTCHVVLSRNSKNYADSYAYDVYEYVLGAFGEDLESTRAKKYRNYAGLLAGNSSTDLHHAKKDAQTHLQNPDVESIATMLDYLQEQGENIVIPMKEGGVMLNLPKRSYKIKGSNNLELAKQIIRIPEIIEWLKKIYNQ